MFTGLIAGTVEITLVNQFPSGLTRLEVRTHLPEAAAWQVGASIALDGCCLTLVESYEEAGGRRLAFELSPETLSRTRLARLAPGHFLNIEGALKAGDPLGGHYVSGHVDGLGEVVVMERVDDGEFCRLVIEVAGYDRDRIAPWLVEKGSVAINGVSLTVNGVRDLEAGGDGGPEPLTHFEIMLIPHTLQLTNLAGLRAGDEVHIEADLLAKYAARAAQFRRTRAAQPRPANEAGHADEEKAEGPETYRENFYD